MKKVIYIIVMLVVGFGYSQNERSLTLNEETNLIEATFTNTEGVIVQTGSYTKTGKLHGDWISYDAEGKKTVAAKYDNGVKTGKWFFWSDTTLREVDYSNNSVANVNTWSSNTIADSRRP